MGVAPALSGILPPCLFVLRQGCRHLNSALHSSETEDTCILSVWGFGAVHLFIYFSQNHGEITENGTGPGRTCERGLLLVKLVN